MWRRSASHRRDGSLAETRTVAVTRTSDMKWGRIGGLLVLGGSALTVPAAAFAGPAAPPGPGGVEGAGLRDLLLSAYAVVLGSGAGVLGVSGPRPLHGRTVRFGLSTVAFGLAGLLVSSLIPIPEGSNELQSWPWIISAALGALAMVVGSVTTFAALLLAPGPSRVVGLLFVAALLLIVAAAPLNAELLRQVGLALAVLGVAGIGVLAIKGDGSNPDHSSPRRPTGRP